MIESLGVEHLVVVEPHADDAFLSMGQHIEERTKAKQLTTIWTILSGTRKRAADAHAYAQAVGAVWVGSGLVEGQPIDGEIIRGAFNGFPSNLTTLFAVPLGITHPEHIAVQALIRGYAETRCVFYVDQPYAITQKNGPVVTDLLRGKRVISYRHPGIRKYRHIPLFRDQAKFYHYNPPEKLIQTCELVVAP